MDSSLSLQIVLLVVAVASVAATVAAIVALYNTRRTAEATLEAARQQAYLAITDLLSLDEAHRSDRAVLFAQDPISWSDWDLKTRDAARRYCALLNVASVFDRRGMLPRGILLEQYYVIIARAWYHAGLWLEHDRVTVPKLYEDFVSLAERAEMKCHTEGIDIATLASGELPGAG